MPLFAPKFSFKKSNPRHSEKLRNEQTRATRSSFSSDTETEDQSEDEESSDKEHLNSSSAKDNSRRRTQSKSSKEVKKKKRNKSPSNDLVLTIDKSKGLVFRFEPGEGVWTLLDRNQRESTPRKAQENREIAKQSTQNEEEMMDKMKAIEEENRLLKLKIEILMEMVTETTAELNIQSKDTNVVNNLKVAKPS